MRFLRALSVAATCAGLVACGSPESSLPPWTGDERTAEQSVVAWLSAGGTDPMWLEEKLAPWPQQAGDRDLGVRQIVRRDAAGLRQVVWSPPAELRLTAAVASPEAAWVAVGVDGDRRPFLARGDRAGLHWLQTLHDPALATDTRAWLGSQPPSALRVGLLSEDSVRVTGRVDQPTVVLVSEHSAVLAYRWNWTGVAFDLGLRTLISPAFAQTPYLPIGASYDTFDAVVHDYGVRVGSAASGAAFVAFPASYARMQAHNRAFGTSLQPLRSDGDLLNRPSDLLVARLRPEGGIAWLRLVGTPDVDDEVYALATGPDDTVALVGRTRRERGRDNSEWHVGLHVLGSDGQDTHSQTVDVPGCGIAQAAAFAEDGSLLIGGTADWLVNPSGISLYRDGRPLLLQVDFAAQGQPGSVRSRADVLPSTQGHAELRALAVSEGRLWLGGLENGPLTHTGDQDASLIRADGWRHVRLWPEALGARTRDEDTPGFAQ